MSDESLSNIYSLKLFCDKYPSFPIAALRNKIFHEKTNGLKDSGAVFRIGKKVFVNEIKFLKWIEEIKS